jgi:hypothetical protein
MPQRTEPQLKSPVERRREVAAILARGVLRLRRINQTQGFTRAPESSPGRRNCLELPGETRISVSDGTRGLRLRDEGDNV